MFKGGAGGHGGVKTRKGTKGLPPHKTRKIPTKLVAGPLVCPEYKCVPDAPKENFCPVPKCADGYDLKVCIILQCTFRLGGKSLASGVPLAQEERKEKTLKVKKY